MRQCTVLIMLLSLQTVALGQHSSEIDSMIKQSRGRFQQIAKLLIGTWTRTSVGDEDAPSEISCSWGLSEKFVRIEGRLGNGKPWFHAIFGVTDGVMGRMTCWMFLSDGTTVVNHLDSSNHNPLRSQLKFIAELPIYEIESVKREGVSVRRDLKSRKVTINTSIQIIPKLPKGRAPALLDLEDNTLEIKIEQTLDGKTDVIEASKWKKEDSKI